MNVVARLFIILFIISLSGCATVKSSFKNQDKKYLDARSIPPLKIPPGISSHSFRSYYPVSSKQYPRELEDVNLEPPGLSEP